MCRKSVVLTVAIILGIIMALPNATYAQASGKEVLSFEGQHSPIWKLKAKRPFLIGGYGDNFNYDGSRVTPVLGKAKVLLDSVKDAGTMDVHLKGTINPEKGKTYTGDIEIYYAVEKGGPAFREGGVADFIYMHNDTKQGPPVMPKVRTYLAAWGSADVYVNGEQVYKGLDGHMMYTERSRDVMSKAIYNRDRSGFYSHKDPTNFSIAAPQESELHFVAHSMEKDKGNFPPNTVWIHLNFERVEDKSYGHRGSYRGARCGHGGGTCGPGCTCGCLAGGPCSCGAGAAVTKYRTGCGHSYQARGMHPCGAAVATCGPGCGCGCLAGGPCTCGTGAVTEGKCGVGCGCGCNEGKPCAMAGGKCGAGCGCGCNAGTPCTMSGKCTGTCNCGCQAGAPCRAEGGKCIGECSCGCAQSGSCNMAAGTFRTGAAVAPCGPGCGCGCVTGGPCSCGPGAAVTPCGPGCGCGCTAGGPCACGGAR